MITPPSLRRLETIIRVAIVLAALLLWPATMWAVDQSGNNGLVKYCVGSEGYHYKGFDIQFYYNGSWRSTTFSDGGYGTYIKVGNADKVRINGSNSFIFGETYTVSGIEVSIVASIPDANSSTVNIQYTVTNTTSSDVTIKLGSCADTQVGDNDEATVSLETNTSG